MWGGDDSTLANLSTSRTLCSRNGHGRILEFANLLILLHFTLARKLLGKTRGLLKNALFVILAKAGIQ